MTALRCLRAAEQESVLQATTLEPTQSAPSGLGAGFVHVRVCADQIKQ